MKQRWNIILLCGLLIGLSACRQQLALVNHYQDWDRDTSLKIVDDYAYTNFRGKFVVYDVSSPETPVQISFDNPAGGDQISVQGSYAYVVRDHFSGESFRIIDISNPQKPVEVGVYPTDKNLLHLAVKDTYAYLTTVEDGLFVVVDISDVTHPRQIKLFEPEGYGGPMAIKDDYLFVLDEATGGKTIRVFDISSPAQPVEITSFELSTFIANMEIVDDYLYVASHLGFYILNVSNPTKPTLIGEYEVSGVGEMVKVQGDYAFIADPLYGIEVVDISNPAKPKGIGYYELHGVNQVSVIDDYVYGLDNFDGLFVFKIPQ